MLEQRIQQQFFDSADLKYAAAEVLAKPIADAVSALVGCITAGGKVLACGHNNPIQRNDPTAHAEIQALRSAGAWLRNYRMPESTLYVTLEPCLMCFGAMIQARVSRVVFGAPDPKVGVTRWRNLFDNTRLNHRFELEGGLLEDECRAILQAFFQRRRARE